jgi:hypothetical protein
MRTFVLLTVVAVSQLLAKRSSQTQTPLHRGLNLVRSRWVEQTIKPLSVGEKIGQMLQIRVYGDYRGFNDPSYRYVLDQIQKYHAGSTSS